jgi:hypothetical protein
MSESSGNQRQNNSGKSSGSNSGGRRKRKRTGQGSPGKSNGSNESKQNKSSRRKEPQVDLAEFWGDSNALPEPIEHIREAGDVKAVVQSLGRVPLSGQETAAEHWFALVYERAAVLAGALAAAGDLLADEADA